MVWDMAFLSTYMGTVATESCVEQRGTWLALKKDVSHWHRGAQCGCRFKVSFADETL